jgi:hypothetical protein
MFVAPAELKILCQMLRATFVHELQPDQAGPPAVTCDLCQRALSLPRTNTSSCPPTRETPNEALAAAATSLVRTPPSELQAFQVAAEGAVSEMCHSAKSLPRTKTSSRPLRHPNGHRHLKGSMFWRSVQISDFPQNRIRYRSGSSLISPTLVQFWRG